MKWFDLIIAAVFVLFAYFQLNDPDPERWVLMYGGVAVLWGLSAFYRYYIPVIYLALIICGIWLLSLFPDFINWVQEGAESIVESMKTEKPHIELTREFLGLAIVIFSLLALLRKARRAQLHLE